MPVAEVFLGAFLQVLFDRLASPKLLEFATREGIRSRLNKLKDNLHIINPVITDAENMLVRERVVNEWLEELKNWAYDADDFLDEVNTRAMQEDEEEEEARRNNTSSSISVSRLVNDLASGFNSGNYSKNVDELNSRLDAIFERMRNMRQMRKVMKIFGTDTTPPPPAMLQRPLEATAHEFDARVFGREQEKERIIEQLKSSRGANLEVIPIVGMPGIGKTTLARHVFQSVQQQEPLLFDIKGWVCVSDDYDVIRITRDILESFTSGTSHSRGLNQLQSELKDVVGGKRFLLVLDDVWSRNYFDDWAPLRSPFGVGAPGSKILVTTRDLRVASMMQTDNPGKIHSLGILLDNDCWSVFLQHVVDEGNSVFKSEAVRFRAKILDKCKGLPLTAKLLAGLLRGESPGQGWEAILNSSIWDVEFSGRKGYSMPPGVMLSYFHLPPHLKPCFSYCSVFPEDHEFGKEEVVLMWIAEGLVVAKEGEQVEVTGGKYFDELVSRSLFQLAPPKLSPFTGLIDASPRFLMHDLISNMAEMVAGKSCLKVDGVPKIDSICVKARYLSYRNFSGLKTEFEAFERAIYLRAFQLFCHAFRVNVLTSYVPLELLMKLKHLRVLCLSWSSVRELPEDIGDLIHLRLVDLSHTSIRDFPESTGSLYNLLALRLQGCYSLTKLPAQMSKLVNLRNLDCSGPNGLVAMPVEMGKLTSLQKLSNYVVGEGLEQGVGQLKGLSHLKGSISISSLQNVRDSKEAREANLMGKEGLQSLVLKWNLMRNSDHGDLQGRVFAELQPHRYLKELIINGYGGLSFPFWIGDDRFSEMRVIELGNCKKCTSLPPLGKLPGLEEIRIKSMAGIVRVGEEFYGKEKGAFPSLRILKFGDLENWSEWSHPAGGSCHFASLQELLVSNCPKLSMSLPDVINVQKLKVHRLYRLLVAFPRQSFLEMDIRYCKLELVAPLKKDEDASQLLPSVASSLIMERVDVVEAVKSARTRMNITCNKYVVGALHQTMMLGSLTALGIARIPKLTHLPGVVLQGLTKLEKLKICWCEELTSLWKMDEIRGLILRKHFLNSLRVLEVEGCDRLVCLVTQGGEEDDTDRDKDISEEKRGKQQCLGLPCGLKTLRLVRCFKLEKLPNDLHNLTSLQKLQILICPNLEKVASELHNLTSLSELVICDCKKLEKLPSELHNLTSLSVLVISACDKLEKLPSGLHNLTSLSVLVISFCRELEKLPGDLHVLSSLSGLKISLRRQPGVLPGHLDTLYSLPETPFFNLEKPRSELHKLTSVSEVGIWGCDKLLKLPSELHNLSSLTELEISGSDMLEKLSSELHNLISLRRLLIENCRRLSCLSEMGFPSAMETLFISDCELLTCLSPSPSSSAHSLKRLDVWNCRNLESLVATADSFPSLESLQIYNCPKLKALPEGIHRLLKDMSIEACQNLGQLSISVHHLPALETLRIRGTPLFPTTMTPLDEPLFSVPLPSSLTTLTISKFKNLSPEAFQNLTSLQSLDISECLGLTSIPDQLLPPSLLSLHISNCPGLTSIPDHLLPPSSLRTLLISRCPGLTSIPDHLLPPSLLSLEISDCPGLTSIPDHLLPPSSLRTINISGCPALTSIPEQFLPPSLLELKISGCPLLDPDFAEGKGRYWPKVKFLPKVYINNRSIFDAR